MQKTVRQLFFGIILVCFFTWSSASTHMCYYCGPDEPGCDDPVATDFKMTNCKDVLLQNGTKNPLAEVLIGQVQRVKSDDVNYSCATLQVQNLKNSSLSGLYRTCVVNSTTHDACSLLTTDLREQHYGNVTKCILCNTNLCNSQTAEDLKNSGPNISILSQALHIVISLIFVKCFLNLDFL